MMEAEEGRYWSAAMLAMAGGDASVLADMLRRGKPISPEIADWIGQFVSGRECNGFSFKYVKQKRRGRPTGERTKDHFLAVLLSRYLFDTQKMSLTTAIRDSAEHFGVDRAAVRFLYPTYGGVDFKTWPEFQDVAKRWEKTGGK